MIENTDSSKTYRLIFMEWITTIAVIIGCFTYLTFKIEKQADRTDRLYEIFIELVKEKNK